MPKRIRVLFVCIGNSCRSPIAEAIARRAAADVIEASSAGVSPLGYIADSTRKVLLERGIQIDGQFSKGMNDDAIQHPTDLLINMTGRPGTRLFPNTKCEDWVVEDPYGEDMETYRRICDDIEARVTDLAARLRARE
jgi:arsenate reductase (thioredoxin)